MNGAIQSYTAPIEDLSPEDYLRWRAGREIAYNIYLASLDIWEIHALCGGSAPIEFGCSLELFLHDQFVSGIITEDDISVCILGELGELN